MNPLKYALRRNLIRHRPTFGVSRCSRAEQIGQIRRSTVAWACAGSAVAGAAAMYFLDPNRGTLRRHRMLEKSTHAALHGRGVAAKTFRYTSDRGSGIVAAARSLLTSRQAPDVVLRDRVRSALGRAVSHPHAIVVDVQQAVATLRGPVLAREVDHALRAARRVRGVRDVLNRMDVYPQAGAVSSLQGGVARPGTRWAMAQAHWDPPTRLLVGTAGAGLTGLGALRRGWSGVAIAALGAGLMVRSLTNLPTRRLIGIGAGVRAVDLQKTMNLHAPIERVFAFFANPTNFPHFMANVRDVRDAGGGRLHWVVAGPLGIPIRWDAEIIEHVPNQRIAWQSFPGSAVGNAGVMKFQPNVDGGTRVDIKFSYNPPGGAIGHAIARALGADPKREMDADLARVKTMLETGHRAHDAAQPAAAEPGADAPHLRMAEGAFIVQCSECGFELEPLAAIPEEVCPRCHARAWQQRSAPAVIPADEPV